MLQLQLHPDRRTLGQFAWIAPIGFGLIAFAAHRFGLPAAGAWSVAALGPATLFAHLAGLPAISRAVWRVLVVATWPIGWVVSLVLIAVVYYGVFTPIGLVRRLFGDPLARRPDPTMATYWRERKTPRRRDSYFGMY